ncbi:hypothetical protein HY637_05040 [Candidatus Woesearchaeota archaeon]|nr:hypothetical protein [Candidatus Woesearchaeota archaeon]
MEEKDRDGILGVLVATGIGFSGGVIYDSFEIVFRDVLKIENYYYLYFLDMIVVITLGFLVYEYIKLSEQFSRIFRNFLIFIIILRIITYSILLYYRFI